MWGKKKEKRRKKKKKEKTDPVYVNRPPRSDTFELDAKWLPNITCFQRLKIVLGPTWMRIAIEEAVDVDLCVFRVAWR